ncbi:hypothetical protein RclHR1_22220002 [Rhizophagus clarus]|uniref:Uncharacterized protein n=1 Tax=Rhizophagus clarus TaxID=94130 RepID=A0A2Z6QU79_9GLOM|nr:hypothetical protein RclHR1_22220002 [Rhizophagus clarus]
MALYQLSLIKLLRFNFVGAIIIFIIYFFFNDINSLNKQVNKVNLITTLPKDVGIKKIDVGQGEDIWILDDNEVFYHWSTIRKEIVSMADKITDFAVGVDGTVAVINSYRNLYIRNINVWWGRLDERRYNGFYYSISICDSKTIFITTIFLDLIKGTYDSYTDTYKWEYVTFDNFHSFVQTSCASRDQSLWIIGPYGYISRYVNEHRQIPRSDISFRQLKALSEEYVIGVDYNNRLWEYSNGTWSLIRNDVKGATVNYNGDIFLIDSENSIYNIKRN